MAFLVKNKLYSHDLFEFCKGMRIYIDRFSNEFPPYVELTDRQQLEAIQRGAKWGGPEDIRKLAKQLRDKRHWVVVWFVGVIYFMYSTASWG